MANALFADISVDQVVSDMAAYTAWSKTGDGFARLMAKATEGVDYKDASFESFWSQALANNISMMACYHYARPDLNPGTAGAANEARWFASVIGSRLRPQDRLMLDFEQNEDNLWARAFHDALMAALPRPVKPVLYDSLSHFNQFFAGDTVLAGMYDAALAAWHPLDQGQPAAPPGWNLLWWQWTDNTAPRPTMAAPGISMPVDLNVWYGGVPSMVPQGPFYKVTGGQNGVPTVGNAIAASMGLTWQDILAIPGQNPALSNYDPTGPYLGAVPNDPSYGVWLLLPGFPTPASAPVADPKAAAAKAALQAWLAE